MDQTVTAAPSKVVRPVPLAAGTSSSVVPDAVARLGGSARIAEQGVLSDQELVVAKARLLDTELLSARQAGADGWAADPEEAAHPSQFVR
jgi:hypothetical protein